MIADLDMEVQGSKVLARRNGEGGWDRLPQQFIGCTCTPIPGTANAGSNVPCIQDCRCWLWYAVYGLISLHVTLYNPVSGLPPPPTFPAWAVHGQPHTGTRVPLTLPLQTLTESPVSVHGGRWVWCPQSLQGVGRGNQQAELTVVQGQVRGLVLAKVLLSFSLWWESLVTP